MKACTKCKTLKSDSEFSVSNRNKDGLQYWCKECMRASARKVYANDPERFRAPHRKWFAVPANRERSRKKSLQWHIDNPEWQRQQTLKNHGITLEQYTEMLILQGGLCAICKESSSESLCVDHDHDCCLGKKSCGTCIRGLLCKPCNLAIGNMRNSPDLLRAAAKYLNVTAPTGSAIA